MKFGKGFDDIAPVRKVRGKKKFIEGGASSKPPVTERKCAGSGSLRIDSEEKDEASYDFVSYSWVDPSLVETSSVYRSSKEAVAFTEENDFVRKDFKGTVESPTQLHPNSWAFIRGFEILCRSYNYVPTTLKFFYFFQVRFTRPLGIIQINSHPGTVAFYKDKDGCDAFPLYWSPRPNAILGVDLSYFSTSDLAEIRYLENRVPLKYSKLIELEGEPEKLKKYIVKMSPKLDKSAMARRIAEKKREAVKIKDENPVPDVGVLKTIQGIRSAFSGRYLELQHVKGLSEIDTLRKKVISLEKDLSGLGEVRTKVAGLEGRVALLNQEKQDLTEKNKTLTDELRQMKTDKETIEATLLQEKSDHEKTKVKSAADRDQFTAEAADSYDSGFNQTLEQVQVFYPYVDTSVCNVLKEVVGGVLVDLIDGEDEQREGPVQTEDLVETVTKKARDRIHKLTDVTTYSLVLFILWCWGYHGTYEDSDFSSETSFCHYLARVTSQGSKARAKMYSAHKEARLESDLRD
ncbi:hypothetical protein SESBI_47004 [Sesbania bispinosa]|nr:hypothetical protein SESBI_47004 [Sesbania bispinosa]